MAAPQTDNIHYDVLVERLFPDFKPAKPVWPVHIRLAIWLTLELGILLAGLATHRADLSQKLQSTQYLLELGVFIVMGTVAAVLALKTAIPGREATRNELAVLSTVALAAIALILCEPSHTTPLAEFIYAGIPCAVFTGMFAALPWLGLFWAVRRGAPLALQTAGALIGVAAFAFAFAVGRLRCPIEDSLHFLIWHMLPGFLGMLLSILAGISWLRRKRSAPLPRTR
ncbi:MAG: DUF1109 family protein [Deltaproteobacteria bacterium]|nr:DUF1109 family protein [Deltaproteobacteria bacterium]